ncbi:MAG TPA: glycosyltransferase family 39 protein [Bryobacteraceae bacterium]
MIVPLFLLYLLHLGSAGFLGPDEPRYASIGREMAQSGDFVTPHLNGAAWFEKPPLLYWLTAVATKVGLRDEWAARVPGALASLGFLLFFFATLEREFSAKVAMMGTAILGTSAGWIAYSYGAVPDVLMSALFGAALLVTLFDTRPGRGYLAGALLGLAMLAKAFVPLVLIAPVWLIARGKRIPMIVSAVAVAVPWHLWCYWRNGPAFWHEYFWVQQVGRFFTPERQHVQPWWYYVPVLLAGLFPWTPLVALLFRRKVLNDFRVRSLLVWIGIGLVFFSAAQNKLPGYLLPLLPAAAIVLAVALDRAPRAEWWIAGCALLLLLLPSIASGLPEALRASVSKSHWTWQLGWIEGIFIVAAAGGAWWAAWKGQKPEGVLVAALAMAAVLGVLESSTLAALDERYSVRAFWQEHSAEVEGACLDSSVSRTWKYGLEYYAGRELLDCGNPPLPGVQIVTREGALAAERP